MSTLFGWIRVHLSGLCGGMIRHFGMHDDTAHEHSTAANAHSLLQTIPALVCA